MNTQKYLTLKGVPAMCTTKRLKVLVGAGLLCGAVFAVDSPVRAGTPCPRVIPRNPYEALQMEQASRKSGCWVRLPDGSLRQDALGFTSDLAPDKNYPALVPDPSVFDPPLVQTPPQVFPSIPQPNVQNRR